MNRRTYLRAVGTAGVVGTAGCLGFGGGSPNTTLGKPDRNQDVSSEDLPYPAWGQRIPDVTLSEPLADRKVTLRDVDRPFFLTFFFTNCMTVCPVLISTLREVQVYSIDEGFGDEVAFYPITFDPARDDAEAFREEATQMNVDLDAGNWHFLTPGSKERARTVVDDEFGVFYQKDPTGGPNEYMFTHLGLILLVNADGYVERAYRGSQPDERELIDDLTKLRQG